MKTIIKVSKKCFLLYCGFIVTIAVITNPAQAQVVTPYMVISPATIKPDCNTYTGCGVIIVKRHYIHRYYRHHYRNQCSYPETYYPPCY